MAVFLNNELDYTYNRFQIQVEFLFVEIQILKNRFGHLRIII